MDNFRIPPSPTWFIPAVCTPDNGVLYIAGNQTSIAHLPPLTGDPDGSDNTEPNAANIQIIHTTNHFKSIVCDRNWTPTTKWFVTLNEQNIVWVWNLKTEKVCRGHKAHLKNVTSAMESQLGGTMCITANGQVLSIDRNAFVKYCIRSNTYTVFDDKFISKRSSVCILKSSPMDENILAAGYRNGLIVIANIKESTILQKLRFHDSEIVSLEWAISELSHDKIVSNRVGGIADRLSKLKVNALPDEKERTPQRKPMRREPPKPIVDAGDMFDIHSYDYLEEEFGTISHPIKSKNDATVECTANDHKTDTNSDNFNFVEACQHLREQICAGNQSDSDDGVTNNGASAVNMTDIRNATVDKDLDGSSADSRSRQSDSADDRHDSESISSEKDAEEPLAVKMASAGRNESDTPVMYLASGAQESSIVIWNIGSGSIYDKIQLKHQPGKSPIPKTNCVIAWIQSDTFVVNGPDGRISVWQLTTTNDPDKSLKFIKQERQFPDVAVTTLCSNVGITNAEPLVWTFSMYLNVIGHQFNGDSSKIIANYSSLPIGMQTMRECPHDPNKIAIAGNNKRISILSLSTLKRDNVEAKSLTSKIQSKVLALAWHPTNENLLCFSTNEGRVGIFNINKVTNPPDLMRNFNGKDVYGLAYGVDVDPTKYVIYATSGHKLVVFNEDSTKNDKHLSITFPSAVSSVSTMKNVVAVGFASGELKMFKNSQLKSEIYAETLSKKYIGEIAWSTVNKFRLAVASNDDRISIVEGSKEIGSDVPSFRKTGELIGHQSGVTSLTWSKASEHRLVSTSFDYTVRIWNTETMECIAWQEYENRMFCAIFMPSDENFILCSGHSETLHIFDARNRSIANVGEFNAKKKKKSSNDVQWASKHQNDASKLRAQEKNKLRKMEKKSAEVVESAASAVVPIKLNHTTILYLTNKELNKEPLIHLENWLRKPSDTENPIEECLHGKLFGERDAVQQLLAEELKNHRSSKTESIGNILIPQINHKLKADIIESIEAKRLTEQQIALAPCISFEFWKNCCLAFANQCIEQGLTFQAIPYLLSVHRSSEAIEKLCEANYYREAWCIAKTYKVPEDNIFETIVTDWLKHLEQTGNLEGAALIAVLAGKPQHAIDVLNKRKSKTQQIDEIVNMLHEQINTN